MSRKRRHRAGWRRPSIGSQAPSGVEYRFVSAVVAIEGNGCARNAGRRGDASRCGAPQRRIGSSRALPGCSQRNRLGTAIASWTSSLFRKCRITRRHKPWFRRRHRPRQPSPLTERTTMILLFVMSGDARFSARRCRCGLDNDALRSGAGVHSGAARAPRVASMRASSMISKETEAEIVLLSRGKVADRHDREPARTPAGSPRHPPLG